MIVELNRRFIHLRDYSTTTVNEGDNVEMIHLAFCG
jgi:sulfur carrier protein ThiS